MIITFFIISLGIAGAALIWMQRREQQIKADVYYHAIALLGTLDDADGQYVCLDPETAVSIGLYLVTIGKR